MRLVAAAVLLLAQTACAGASPSPPAPPPAPSAPTSEPVPMAASSDAPAPAAPRATDVAATPSPTAPDAFRVMGRCRVLLSDGDLPRGATPATSIDGYAIRYERFRERRALRVGYGYLHARFSGDASTLLVWSDDEARLRTYDVPTGRLLASASTPGLAKFESFDAAIDPGEARLDTALVAAGGVLRKVRTRDGEPVAELDRFATDAHPHLDWTTDQTVLGLVEAFIPSQTGTLTLYASEAHGLHAMRRFGCRERVDGWALDRDRKRLLVAFYPSNEIAMHDLDAMTELWRTPAPRWGGAVALGDGALGAVGGEQTWLFDAADPSRRAAYRGQRNNASGLAFSPDGRALALAAYDGRVRLFAPSLASPTLRPSRELRHAGTANVYEPVFSIDGRLLATGSGDKTVRIWGE